MSQDRTESLTLLFDELIPIPKNLQTILTYLPRYIKGDEFKYQIPKKIDIQFYVCILVYFILVK